MDCGLDAEKHFARTSVRNTVDSSGGKDDLFHHEEQGVGVRVEVVNLTNVTALYNYLSAFSGILSHAKNRDPGCAAWFLIAKKARPRCWK